MNNARFFTTPASAGYGARIFLEVCASASLRNAHKTLKHLSIWKGHDKSIETNDDDLFFGYEVSESSLITGVELLRSFGFEEIQSKEIFNNQKYY